MSLFKFSCTISLLFATALAGAAPLHRAAKPPPPSPEALHEKMAQINQDPASLSAAVVRGQKSAAVCRHCHGVGGNSVLSDVPNLASQNASYLLEQMNKYVLGQRKSSDFMQGMIKALSPEERIDIALFLSQQPVTRKAASDNARSVAGKKVYYTLCVSCHGTNGIGTEKIPRLAGQQVKYVEDSMKRYRSGGGQRMDAKMAAYARNLTDADIQNLAGYLATLHP